MKIAFFGTGEFSSHILEDILVDKDFSVKFAVSQPDKAVGRKKIITPTPVKKLSEEYGVEVLQPKSLRKDEVFLETLKKAELDFIIVVAYGKIIPPSILELPKYGCINIHGSMLPKYRGASPIQAAIKNGESKTGITIMYMSEGMDEGDILQIKEIDIQRDDTTADIFQKFEKIGKNLLKDSLEKIVNNSITPQKQNEEEATYCGKIEKKDGEIDFTKQTAKEIYNQYKAYHSWPGIYSFFNEKKIAFTEIDFANMELEYDDTFFPGVVIEIENEHGPKKKSVGVVTKDGIVLLKRVKLEGKKEMDILSFINGNKEFLDYSF